MAATIIIPTQKSKELIEYVKNHKNKEDELITLDTKDVSSKLDDIILKASHECVILCHPNFKSFDKNYISLMKRNFSKEQLVICNTQENVKERYIDKNSAICFSRDLYKRNTKKIFDIVSIERKMLSSYTNIKVIDNKIQPVKENTKGRLQEKKNEIKSNRKERVRDARRKKNTRHRRVRPDKEENKENVVLDVKNRKPKILFLADVVGWAGWIKSEYIQKCLSEYYDIDIINLIGKNKKKPNPNKYDLYFTFGYSYVNEILKVPFKRRITGLTAHRPHRLLSPQMKKVYATHANSVLLYNELKSMHNFPFYVPNGVDVDLFYEKTSILSDHDEPIFGHVGKKGKMKNQSTILEPAVKKANVKYYPHYNDYTNKISHDKMVDIHQNYDVLLIASSEDATPNSFLEASACGRMTIGNKIGNLPEFIVDGGNGILLDSGNIDDYIDVIKGCKNNPDKVYEMGQNAKETVRNYGTGELMSKNYKYMFDRILGIERDGSEYDNPAIYHIQNYIG